MSQGEADVKHWRHDNLRATKITLKSRILQIDGDGFIKEPLTPDEAVKLGNMPKWSYCDSNGPEIVALRRGDAEKLRNGLQNEIAKQHQVLEHLEQRLADISQRVVTLAHEESAAAVRVAAEARQQPKVNVSTMNYNQLRQTAAGLNISVTDQDRSDVEAAIETALSSSPSGSVTDDADE